jgi:hypothetical protein
MRSAPVRGGLVPGRAYLHFVPQSPFAQQRGHLPFVKLVEVVVGAAISAFVLWGLVAFANRMVATAASLNGRLVAAASADRLVERLATDAVSAWTVSAPSPNEIDFFSEDGSHRTFAWSYRFDPTQQTVTRSSGEVFSAISGFVASNADASDLTNPSAAAYDPLLRQSNVTSVPGNAFVVLQLVGTGVSRTEYFASGAAPTGFTVVVQYTPSPTPLTTATPAPLR